MRGRIVRIHPDLDQYLRKMREAQKISYVEASKRLAQLNKSTRRREDILF